MQVLSGFLRLGGTISSTEVCFDDCPHAAGEKLSLRYIPKYIHSQFMLRICSDLINFFCFCFANSSLLNLLVELYNRHQKVIFFFFNKNYFSYHYRLSNQDCKYKKKKSVFF